MSRVEVKNKVKEIIRCMLLSDLEVEKEIPDAVAHQILQNYNCSGGEKSSGKDNLDSFLRNFQKWVENNHANVEPNVNSAEKVDFDLSLYKKYIQAETEYCEVTSELATVLAEVVKHKETHSEYFKNECNARDSNVEILSKKCQFLKLQFFLKLYGEENALMGHLALKMKLKEELDSLKKKHNELLDYNKRMSDIKYDKTFCELFKAYKELRRIEQMTEIIGNM